MMDARRQGMRMKALWMLLATVVTAVARPSLAQYDWADVDRAVATAHYGDGERTPLIDKALAQEEGPPGVGLSVADSPVQWTGIAGITLDPRGQLLDGYVQVRDALFGWDYVNDPAWMQNATCRAVNARIDPARGGDDLADLARLTCVTLRQPSERYSSALGPTRLEREYGRYPAPEADAPLESTEAESLCGGTGSRESGDQRTGGGCSATDLSLHPNSPVGWGISVRRTDRSETYVRVDRDGSQQITHVIWSTGS